MSLKLVIFDVDGLLLDTERVWQDVWYDTARDFGIEYEQILCKLLCEVLYTLIEVSGVTDGLYKHEWNIIIGYLERAMEVLTGVDASGVDPLHLHEPAHRGGVNLTIVDAAADGVDGLLTLVALRPCLRLCIVLCPYDLLIQPRGFSTLGGSRVSCSL